MRRTWMLGGVGGMLLVSTLLARPGIVKTRDGQTVAGDVTEQGDQIVVDSRGIHTTIDRDNLRSITYSDTIEQETRKRLARLTPYDVAGRVELSQWLFENKAYDLSLSILDNAASIQPRNEDVIQMRRTVQRQMLLEQSEARKHQPIQLAAADNRPPAGAAPGRADAAPGAEPGRLLTPEEINEVKQAEWQEGQQVRATFKNDVRRKYIASSGVEANTFNRMPPAQQAWAIVKNGTPEMKKDVILTNDPPAMATFKRVQQSLISTGCANCHSGNKAQGNFSLHFPANSAAATYTNFLILQQYQEKIGDRQYSMIDRTQPDSSLLVQFAMPPDVGRPPHPKAANYKGAVHGKADARLKQAVDWISSLNPVTPDYSDIELAPKQGTERPMVPPTASRPAVPTAPRR
jgi:hypothetical protein